jgi:hypothetical protein
MEGLRDGETENTSGGAESGRAGEDKPERKRAGLSEPRTQVSGSGAERAFSLQRRPAA